MTNVNVFDQMLQHRFVSVVESDDKCELVFTDLSGYKYRFYHDQECCEDVWIEEIIGDLHDLEDEYIVEAEVCVNTEPEISEESDSETWTFYKFRTKKGSVTIRWVGSSNGYYSERVDFQVIHPDGTVI